MFKHLGLYEMILETIFKHWILVLGTPERCPALEQFRLFACDYFRPFFSVFETHPPCFLRTPANRSKSSASLILCKILQGEHIMSSWISGSMDE